MLGMRSHSETSSSQVGSIDTKAKGSYTANDIRHPQPPRLPQSLRLRLRDSNHTAGASPRVSELLSPYKRKPGQAEACPSCSSSPRATWRARQQTWLRCELLREGGSRGKPAVSPVRA